MTHSGGKPHTNIGDRGQPYEITYDDGAGNRKVMGWAETSDGVAQMMRSIELHPTWHSPQWRDRRSGETGPAMSISRVSDVYLQSSLQEISRHKALDSQMISTAFLRMLLTEIVQRRAADGAIKEPQCPALRAYDEAMDVAGVPHEALEVYTSNSWRRVGLARAYSQVIVPCVDRDGQPNISGTDALRALVAAFNAMLELREGTKP